MEILMYSICSVYLVFLPFYCYAENNKGMKTATIMKLVLSGIFVIVGIIALFNTKQLLVGGIFLAGLIVSMVADFFMQFIYEKKVMKLNVGIILFTIAQGLYITAIILGGGFNLYAFSITALIVLTVLLGKLLLKLDLGKSNILLSIYVLILSVSLSLAITSFFYTTIFSLSVKILLVVGLSLFLISDVVLGLERYYKRSKVLVVVNRVTYFLAQILIAISIFYLV